MKYSIVYEKMMRLARSSGMTKRDADAFYAAYEQALDSDANSYRMGCVIVCGNQIIGRGFNSSKTDPTQKLYNLRYRDFVPGDYSNNEHSLHAEMAALKSIPYTVAQKTNWKKVKAYVYRIAPGLTLGQGVSAPCCACARALADMGIRKVYFSTDYGFASSILDPNGIFDTDCIGPENAAHGGRNRKSDDGSCCLTQAAHNAGMR